MDIVKYIGEALLIFFITASMSLLTVYLANANGGKDELEEKDDDLMFDFTPLP